MRAFGLRAAGLALVCLVIGACGKSDSYQEGFKAGQRLSTVGVEVDAACKAAFILSSASDRDEYLKGCDEGLKS